MYIKTNINDFLNEQKLNENFKKWFSNSILKKNGKPIIMYHGTNIEFDTFNINKMRSGWLSKGFYFTESKEEAKHYGKIILPVYLKIEHPFIIEGDTVNDDGTVNWSRSTKEQLIDKYPEIANIDNKDISNFLYNKGYDAIINSFNLVTVFNPNQIKSVNNNGDFSITDLNIYH